MRRAKVLILLLAGIWGADHSWAAPRCEVAKLDRALREATSPTLLLYALTETCQLPRGLRSAVLAYARSGHGGLNVIAGSHLLEWLPFVMTVCPGATRKLAEVARNVPQDQATDDWLRACGLSRLAPGGAPRVSMARGVLAVALYGWLSPGDERRARTIAEHLLQPERPKAAPARNLPLFRMPRIERLPDLPPPRAKRGSGAVGGRAGIWIGGGGVAPFGSGRAIAPRARLRGKVFAELPKPRPGTKASLVHRQILRKLPTLKRCYETALRTNPKLEARARIALSISPIGRVKRATIRGVGPELGACLRSRAVGWRFLASAKSDYAFTVRFTP